MQIRTIVVSYEIDSASPILTRSAVQLAQRFGAGLIGIAAAEPGPVLASPESGMIAAGWYAQGQEEVEAWLQRAEQEFRSNVPADLPVDWRAYVDMPNRALAANAAGADLILVGGRMADGDSRDLRSLDIGGLILAAGRPVLVTAADATKIGGESILIGWKDTREARRSVADALPLLQGARQVTVTTVHEGDMDAERASLTDLLAWLNRHGIAAKGDVHSMQEGPGATLRAVAAEVQADLVVTGAYGHSRMREWLFGGMTRDLLAAPSLARFMSN